MSLQAALDLMLEHPFIWQSTLWLLLGLGVSHCNGRHPARAHAVLLAALTGAIVSPAISLLSGRLGWSLLPRRIVEVSSDWAAAPGGALQASAQRIDTFLYVVSGLMMGVCLLGFVRSLSSARRMLRDCSRVTDPEAMRALAAAKQRSSPGYEVELLERKDIGSPSIWCWSHPAIILVPPRLSSRLSVECLASIFSHELAHLTRRDHLKSLLANVFLSAIAWNPLAWYVRWRLGQLAEQACDAAASTSDRASADYAEALLRLAVARPPRLGLAIARYGGLSLRIRRILDGQDSRLTIGRGFFAFLGAGVLVSSTLLAPVQRAQGVEYLFPDGLRVAPIELGGGAFFIRETDEGPPEGYGLADPVTSSEPLRWTTED